jgi:hypothetical protein
MKAATISCLSLALLGVSASGQVKVTETPGRVHVEIAQAPFGDLITSDPETGKPYFWPLRTVSGKEITRHFPMEHVRGESTDHPHHRGLWFAHGDVNGLDFWASETADQRPKTKIGKIVLAGKPAVKSGWHAGSLTADFHWQDSSGAALLTEHRIMTFSAGAIARMIDLDITLRAVQQVKFGDTKEGCFAIRLGTPFEVKHGARMVNAEGVTGIPVWGKRSKWVDYKGNVQGELVGVAIFDHPANPRHPTYWHARDYGLFAANIWGVHDFTNDKTKDGSMILKPGETLRFRYRVFIHPGADKPARVEAMYRKYAGGPR